MAEQHAKASQAGATAASGPTKPPKPPNPIWKMMGIPNFRLKLPSRNWMIFLGITGSWTAAVLYDRREKKRIQKRWTKLVSHIAQEPLDTQQLPRKLTVYVSAPPADGLVPARDHFCEYVKPILVAAALDWDAVEGRREGDVRAGLAERIRRLRKKRGEPSNEPVEEDFQELLEETRARSGVRDWNGTAGDIVIGRHAWKEYVRGLHEGWLGPLDPPTQAKDVSEASMASSATPQETSLPADQISPSQPVDDASPTVVHETPPQQEPEKPKEEENKPKKKKQPPPFNTTADYNNAILSPNCPPELPPSAVIQFPHLLGFLNFPIRMYRFLNRRKVADDIGRQTAAAVLAVYRPYDAPGESRFESEPSLSNVGDEDDHGSIKWEQQRLLKHEEKGWHKSVRERKDDGKERVWLDDMVLDPRIAERMRKFELDMEAEERSKRITVEKEDTWWKSLWAKKEKKHWEELND
ncbi:hypothetical protein K469DRAFT_670232 [Zopfia rhizophila CBS 207.26]|uniref:Mitochondrial import inner membrane translocase subunit TIM54 n=1 Tax=Zopfia rhizophila CBS 207.26 TaxID=1314779 RepID=A0A6A6DWC1_9PEZI|nr:hypothetical protein K469DRAFT_670232 [Zopfia rhizophila CBS 207.26]